MSYFKQCVKTDGAKTLKKSFTNLAICYDLLAKALRSCAWSSTQVFTCLGCMQVFVVKEKALDSGIGHPWNGTTILLLCTDRKVLPAYESSGCHGPFTYIDDVLWKFLLKIPKSDTNHLDRKSWGAVLRWLLLAMSTIKKSWYILLLGKMLCVTFCFAGEIILKFFLYYILSSLLQELWGKKKFVIFIIFFPLSMSTFLIIIILTKMLRLKLCHERLNEHFNVTSPWIQKNLHFFVNFLNFN